VRRTKLIGTAETAASFQLELALNADSAEERGPAAETDRGQGELWERVLGPENLNEAWRRVRENGGAAGIDRMSVAAFPAFYRANWTKVRAKLQAGTYVPSPVRRTLIPKKHGGERPLGIPTVCANCTQEQRVLGMGCDHASVPSVTRPTVPDSEDEDLFWAADGYLGGWGLRHVFGSSRMD
jgi:hypothetical protein